MDRKDLERIPMTGWIAFLEGKDPSYPERALRQELSFIREQTSKIHNDPTTPDTRLADWPLGLNPVTSHELVRLMLGGNLYGKIFVPHTRVRYFDPVSKRAGIPTHVASLVTEMTADAVRVVLVNLDQVEGRQVVVQTGSYGEHQCLSVEMEGKQFPIDGRFFHVQLAPGAGAELKIRMRRYANPPTLDFPW